MSNILTKEEGTPLSPKPPYSIQNGISYQIKTGILTETTIEILKSRPDPIEDKSDLDYFLQPDGTIIRVNPSDYRDPNKKTYPDAIPILWEEWLEGESEGPGSLEINDATIIVATGLKGSGKSLLLAWLGAKALAIGMPVWSNMGIKFYLFTHKDELKLCESKPLDWNALLMLSKELENGAAIIDELRYYASSRQSSSVRNRIINVIINQVRKRALDFYASVKFLRQIDVDIRDELSAEIACEDMALTCKGQGKLDKGCLIKWQVRDISGWSGHPISRRGMLEYEPLGTMEANQENDQPIYRHQGPERCFNGRPFWPIFNSYEVVDLVDAFRKVKFDLEETVITDKPQSDEIEAKINNCFDNFRNAGNMKPKCDEVREALSGVGLNFSPVKAGKIIKKYTGIESTMANGGRFYDLN